MSSQSNRELPNPAALSHRVALLLAPASAGLPCLPPSGFSLGGCKQRLEKQTRQGPNSLPGAAAFPGKWGNTQDPPKAAAVLERKLTLTFVTSCRIASWVSR